MEDKIFIKEKRNIPHVLTIFIISIVGAIVGSLITYFVACSKIDKISSTSGSQNQVVKISSDDSPVVAISKKAGPSVVGVKVSYTMQGYFGRLQEADEEGSGIIYSSDGYIITNYHVIESAINNSSAKVEVTISNDEAKYEASIIGVDETTDLAVIKIDRADLIAAEFGISSDLQVGEIAVAIGNPLGQEFAGSVTVGYISALNRKITTAGRTYNLIQTDAAINSGNSGGALVNSNGQVIGINSVKVSATGVEGLGFSIPIDDALPIIKELIEKGSIVRPVIGISGINVDEQTARINNIKKGVYVASVIEGTPAESAGIKKGDIITKIDDTDIESMEKLNEIKNSKKVGDKISLTISRNSKTLKVELSLASSEEFSSKSVSTTN